MYLYQTEAMGSERMSTRPQPKRNIPPSLNYTLQKVIQQELATGPLVFPRGLSGRARVRYMRDKETSFSTVVFWRTFQASLNVQ